jgi:flagellar hook-length control protein FliK
VSSVTPEASAVRHAHLGQGPRSNFPSTDWPDQTSPFAALLDGASDASPPPASPPPLSSQKPTPRPPAGHATEASAPETASGATTSPSDRTAPDNPTGSVPAPPTKESQDTGTAEAVLALAALAKKAAQDSSSTINRAVDVTVASGTADAAPANDSDATDASSTAPAAADTKRDKTADADSSASDSFQPTIPPVDPSASQPVAVAQPVAILVSAPVISAAASTSGNGGGGEDADDDAQIAAMGAGVKIGAPGGNADRMGADPSKGGGDSTAASGTASGAQPAAKTADTAAPTPPRPPQPAAADSPTGPGQPNTADGPQSRTANGVLATDAANLARQHAASRQPTDAATGSQTQSDADPNGNSNLDPNVDPSDSNVEAKRDPAASASRIEDIARQALDSTARRIEATAAETGSGASHPAGAEAGNAQQQPDGSSGLIAPAILTTTAAPAAPTTTPTPTAVPIAGLAVEIASHAHAGRNRFEIRLDPPELGRIDVRLDVDRDGKVASRLVVDRPETLDILRRDAPELERSLQQAGLKTADNALQFSLRDHGGFGGQNPYFNNGSPGSAARVVIPDRELPPVAAATSGYVRMIGTRAGVDIRV